METTELGEHFVHPLDLVLGEHPGKHRPATNRIGADRFRVIDLVVARTPAVVARERPADDCLVRWQIEEVEDVR
jgi:hypothetical protein